MGRFGGKLLLCLRRLDVGDIRHLMLLVGCVATLSGGMLLAQTSVPKTCKDMPVQCDKELLLLKDEIEQKRHVLAGAWAISEAWQARAEKAEARVQELEALQAPATKD